MNVLKRVFVALFASVATLYFVLWLPLWFFVPMGRSPAVRIPVALLCAIAAFRYFWRRRPSTSTSRGLLASIARGALLVGITGFLIGFVGPMIVAPTANQGPLLGILITGPLGCALGAIGGGIGWLVRRGKSESTRHDEGGSLAVKENKDHKE